jgi:hypothetical protein
MESDRLKTAWIRAVLAKRHPATSKSRRRDNQEELGPWTVLEEFELIDFLAISANKHPEGYSRRAAYPRVGYEIKVSRSDMRSELLKPSKRAYGRMFCHEFWFAVPQGLLKEAELAYVEPDWKAKDFTKPRCQKCWRLNELSTDLALGTRVTESDAKEAVSLESGKTVIICPNCKGSGKLKSHVEKEAPTLWVPKDCGLIEIDDDGHVEVIKKSPINKPRPLNDREIGQLVRWVSTRPDPRHLGLIDRLRQRAGRGRSRGRRRKR